MARIKTDLMPDVDVLRKLYIDEQLDQSEIATKFGVRQPSVSRWLKEAGIEIRRGKAAHRPAKRGAVQGGVVRLRDLAPSDQKVVKAMVANFQRYLIQRREFHSYQEEEL